jgi:hypothetical protein
VKKLLFVLMLCLFALFNSCKDPEPVDFNFLFKETYCANPWDGMITPEWTREQVISFYLTDLDIEFSDLHITDDGVLEVCFACHCLTGDNIRFSADDEFSEILLENGFELD